MRSKMCFKIKQAILFGLLGIFTMSCTVLRNQKTPQEPETPEIARKTLPNQLRRPRLPSVGNQYEGSLWSNESSFGNLWRDHRARYKNDLLTINEIGQIITLPETSQTEQDTTTDAGRANIALEALTLRDQLEKDQNDILASTSVMSVEVVRVLPNGNMVIRGQKVDHRQQNGVRYITTIQGVLRPVDIDDSNIVSATKLVYPEVKVKRQILGNLLRQRLEQLSPLVGKQNSTVGGRIADILNRK